MIHIRIIFRTDFRNPQEQLQPKDVPSNDSYRKYAASAVAIMPVLPSLHKHINDHHKNINDHFHTDLLNLYKVIIFIINSIP